MYIFVDINAEIRSFSLLSNYFIQSLYSFSLVFDSNMNLICTLYQVSSAQDKLIIGQIMLIADMLEQCFHMDVSQILKVNFKWLNPVYNLVAGIINLKNAMNDGLIKLDALVHNTQILQLFKVDGSDRLNKTFHVLLLFFIFLCLSLRLFLNLN